MDRHHGLLEHRGMNEAARTPSGRVRSHRFANRFARLEPYDRSRAFLSALGGVSVEGGELTGPMLGDPGADRTADVAAGVAFLGQFLDHEITFDPTSSLEREADPRALRNFRTPALDLDSVYGGGREVRPFLYDDRDDAKLLTGPADPAPGDPSRPPAARFGATDLQRNHQGAALLADPRNDENVIISQLQLAVIRFHNRVVDHLRSGTGTHLVGPEEDVYHAARRLVRWHYQWLILEWFLPRVCDGSVLDDVARNGRRYFLRGDDPVAIPVEFAGAAYRYGHSQIRDRYTVNDQAEGVQFFPGPPPERVPDLLTARADEGVDPPTPPGSGDMAAADGGDTRDLRGFRPVPEDLVVDWRHLFDFTPEAPDSTAQPGRPIDAALPPALFHLPFVSEGPRSLAARNLERGVTLGLPSGQAVARALDVTPIDNEGLPMPDGRSFADVLRARHRGADEAAPLWLYVLAEADRQADGHRLGAVGSRIVAEVIVGMVDADERSYRSMAPGWTPVLPRLVSEPHPEGTDPYRMADLLALAMGPAPDGLGVAAVDADGTGPAPDTPDDDPTDGEAVVLEHRGDGPLPIDGYGLDLGDQTATLTTADGGLAALEPGDRLAVYTGPGPADPETVGPRVLALEREAPALRDQGETVAVTTRTGEVSDHATFG